MMTEKEMRRASDSRGSRLGFGFGCELRLPARCLAAILLWPDLDISYVHLSATFAQFCGSADWVSSCIS